ncbi:Octamer-binding transcription factor [Parasponia andersonii]|uniref:Octamer-binding transcription factor n=1 Tax=Parasponia andersonii TaxID=3476 RepID=A0A2P5CQV6_PARAD|nr:Octamer-binding transcription factor [Parasponia andersonii]
MEFKEQEDQDQDQDQDEEIEEIPAAPPGYDSSSARPRPGAGVGEGGASSTNARKSVVIRYRDCQKNHALKLGGHAVDGCCEFMAAGEEGTLDALMCAACNCHRNFHRQECTDGGGAASSSVSADHHHNNYQLYHHGHGHQFSSSPYYGRAAPSGPSGYLHLTSQPAHPSRPPLALQGVSSGGGGGGQSREEGEDASIPSSSGGSGSRSKKRLRTRFTAEQKEKMHEFAERVGWRIQKHDDAAVEQFCLETGVNRHVLKVWMHNNKHTLGKKP